MITLDDYFDGVPYVRRSAPGRVNLLGEHTDYNDGFMLPIATPQRTEVALGLSGDQRFHLYSAALRQRQQFDADGSAPAGFGRYIEGCIRGLQQRGFAIPPLRIHVHSNLPIGAGLSSSAALEIATLRALRSLFHLDLDDVTLARIAQQAEIVYAEVHCGILDQMAASLADSTHMLLIDARTLATQLLPLPSDSALIVIDSGVPRTLAASKYNERRAECEAAAAALQVAALRDVTEPSAVDMLPAPLRQRARHVVSENQRVLQAVHATSAAEFGALMNASHYSLRDDYQVSTRELDRLTATLREHQPVYGARLTGAGFGGACVALCAGDQAAAVGAAVVARFNADGGNATLLIP